MCRTALSSHHFNENDARHLLMELVHRQQEEASHAGAVQRFAQHGARASRQQPLLTLLS